MRICNQCKTEMVEGFYTRIDGAGYGIKIAKGAGIFARRLQKPKVAVCPNCGEVSIYIEDLRGIAEDGKLF